jgi:hypothetical protein
VQPASSQNDRPIPPSVHPPTDPPSARAMAATALLEWIPYSLQLKWLPDGLLPRWLLLVRGCRLAPFPPPSFRPAAAHPAS